MTPNDDLYRIPLRTITGEETSLAPLRGNVLLIANVASACGFTPQYAGLEKLYRKFQAEGLVVLGFPCNQFGHQEPACEADIRSFTKERYDITFPLFEKIDVNGAHTHPLYRLLKAKAPGILGTQLIKWNFTKFLVDRSGNVARRFGPRTTPEDLEQTLVGLLAAPKPASE